MKLLFFILLASTLSFSSNKIDQPVNAIKVWLDSKPTQLEEDFWYKSHIEKSDPRLASEYENRWRYHDSQVYYNYTGYDHELYEIGSFNMQGRNPKEEDLRNELARRTLRTRIDDFIKHHIEEARKNNQEVRTAHAIVEKAKDLSIKTQKSSDSDLSFQFETGYSLVDDSFRFICRNNFIEGSFLQSGSMDNMMKNRANNYSLNVRVSPQPLPQAFLSYYSLSHSVSTGIEKQLSKRVSSQLQYNRPVETTSDMAHSYMVTMRYSF